jgi:enediyne biosynthesis protein E8
LDNQAALDNQAVSDNPAADRRYLLTLEAFADTFVPGERRFPDDIAVVGAAAGAGAVAAGAIELLHTPATGISEILPDLVGILNEHAAEYATANGIELDGIGLDGIGLDGTALDGTALDGDAPAFVSLGFAQRSELLRRLTDPDHPEKEFWILAALFCFMAFDTAAHTGTASAIENGHPGLATMGFAAPGPDGLWRFADFSYGRQLARIHPDTTPSGDPA